MNRTTAPGVDTYCLYGSDINTTYSYVFTGSVLDGKYVKTGTMDGDGNQDIIDNTFCSVWKSEGASAIYSVEAFAGVHHMQMYSNDKVIARIHDIISSYSYVDDES
jgi:hypothetical protein